MSILVVTPRAQELSAFAQALGQGAGLRAAYADDAHCAGALCRGDGGDGAAVAQSAHVLPPCKENAGAGDAIPGPGGVFGMKPGGVIPRRRR